MLKRILTQRKETILKRWLDLILESYPPDTRRFLRSQRDEFANPVGHTLAEGIRALYEGLVQGGKDTEAAPSLDRIVRVRAVQDLSPSRALDFLFSLKAVIREELGDEIDNNDVAESLRSLEERIDAVALQAFDIYAQCRERIHEIRVNEVRNRTYRLLKRYNLVSELEDEPTAEGPADGQGS